MEREYTDTEMMTVSVAREITDDMVVFVGTFWPVLPAMLARCCHAPNAVFLYEAGIVYTGMPGRFPMSTVDPSLSVGADMLGDSFDTLGTGLAGGFVDLGILSASAVDIHGNINSTVIGDYTNPKVRLPGSGGAADIGAFARKYIIVLEQDKKRFLPRLDYLTTPGFLDGPGGRERLGLPGSGPYLVVTTMGLFTFDDETKHMVLSSVHPGYTTDDVRAGVGWELEITDTLEETPPPTPRELSALRDRADPQGMFLDKTREKGIRFPTF
jgi:glutaconate CoA-transferase subunit B